MNRPNQFPFMMPFGGFPLSIYSQQPQQNLQPITIGPPPARVRVALDFLTDLAIKGMKRAAVNDIAIEIIDGQQLGFDEKEAQKAACRCLIEYFAGKTKPDKYEQIQEKKTERKVLADGKPGMILTCIGCGGNSSKTPYCQVCKGAGEIMVFPVTKNNLDGE